jgi:hypothetical protein
MEANCPTIKGDLLKLVRQLEDASCIQIIPTTNFHTFCPAGLVNSQQLKGQTIWLGGPPINARKKWVPHQLQLTLGCKMFEQHIQMSDNPDQPRSLEIA